MKKIGKAELGRIRFLDNDPDTFDGQMPLLTELIFFRFSGYKYFAPDGAKSLRPGGPAATNPTRTKPERAGE